MPAFVAEILRPNLVEEGIVTIESTASAPRNLAALLELHSLVVPTGPSQSLKAANSAEVSDLLEAALADPIDFWFVPSPKAFALYADNNEYVTFFANKKAALAAVVDGFAALGLTCGSLTGEANFTNTSTC